MVNIVGIAGSLRAQSVNAALLKAARELMPAESELVIANISDIPLYNGDLEQNHYPLAATELKNLIAEADGLLLVTPEYNHGIPGVLKNTLDWLSRPGGEAQRVFEGKPVAIMGATPGGMGTIQAQRALLPTLSALATRPWFGASLFVSSATQSFDANGALHDEALEKRLTAFMAGFITFIAA